MFTSPMETIQIKLTSDQPQQESMQLRGGGAGGLCCGLYVIPIFSNMSGGN